MAIYNHFNASREKENACIQRSFYPESMEGDLPSCTLFMMERLRGLAMSIALLLIEIIQINPQKMQVQGEERAANSHCVRLICSSIGTNGIPVILQLRVAKHTSHSIVDSVR